MSVQLAPEHVLERIALEYNPEGRFANKPCPPASKVAIIAANDPTAMIQKKLRSVVRNGGVGASKMLRLHGEVTTRGVANGPLWDAFIELIEDEADRLVERAVELSTRHGHKARVQLSTIKALHKAGFVEAEDLKLIEHNMLTQAEVRKLVATYNGVDAIRWEQLKKTYSGLFQESTPVVKTRKAKKRKPMICKASRREAGVVVLKPLTKAAFLLLKDSFGNLLPASAKKQAIKAERTAKAQQRRRVSKANGGGKVGGPGEGVTVRRPVLDWCKAGHAGTKAAK